MIVTLWTIFYELFSPVMANKERTFIMVKPDGVQRGLVGKIIQRFEEKGFKLVALKFLQVSCVYSTDIRSILMLIYVSVTTG